MRNKTFGRTAGRSRTRIAPERTRAAPRRYSNSTDHDRFAWRRRTLQAPRSQSLRGPRAAPHRMSDGALGDHLPVISQMGAARFVGRSGDGRRPISQLRGGLEPRLHSSSLSVRASSLRLELSSELFEAITMASRLAIDGLPAFRRRLRRLRGPDGVQTLHGELVFHSSPPPGPAPRDPRAPRALRSEDDPDLRAPRPLGAGGRARQRGVLRPPSGARPPTTGAGLTSAQGAYSLSGRGSPRRRRAGGGWR
jgi:hypothetical protein